MRTTTTLLVLFLGAIGVLVGCGTTNDSFDGSLVVVVKVLNDGETVPKVLVMLVGENEHELLTDWTLEGKAKFTVIGQESRFRLYIIQKGALVYTTEVDKSKFKVSNGVMEVIVDIIKN